MHRNLDRRIESLVRVRNPLMHDQMSAMLDLAFSKYVVAWDLSPEGQWTRTAYKDPAEKGSAGKDRRRLLDYQAELAALTVIAAANA
jgi:polyphosphate kinase